MGLVRDTEFTEAREFYGESGLRRVVAASTAQAGDTDSPFTLRPSARPIHLKQMFFVCRYLPDRQKVLSLCPLCLRGEGQPFYGFSHNSKSTSVNSCQGSPWIFNCSMKGSGSNSSVLKTPAFFHFPVRNSIAPIIAGTPVV